jgi:hypothetical protein
VREVCPRFAGSSAFSRMLPALTKANRPTCKTDTSTTRQLSCRDRRRRRDESRIAVVQLSHASDRPGYQAALTDCPENEGFRDTLAAQHGCQWVLGP